MPGGLRARRREHRRAGQRLDTHVGATLSSATLQEWVITGGVLADYLGRPDADRDLIFALNCGPRCGASSESR